MSWASQALEQLKFWKQCEKYGLSIWQCPSFLFLLMGVATIGAMMGTYVVANLYAEPFWVATSVVSVAVLIFTIGWLVVNSFEKLAVASRMKTEFVSIVSHQLRTPLTSMKWSLELLLSGRLGEIEGKQSAYLLMFKESNERMIRLVNDLLNVSRVEERRILLKKEKFDIEKLAKSLGKEFFSYAEANNITVEVENTKAGIEVYADKKYISMVLSNLVDNAIRYIEGSGKVSISAHKEDGNVLMEVRDNGVGIPQNEQRNIFHKFFRSSNVLRHRTEGTGLGLYLARSFIELHGGKMGFTSKEGEGSTFWFTLPL